MSADRPSLEDLVAAFVEARERGETVEPASFAARHPEHAGLRDALDRLLELEGLFPDAELAAGLGLPERIGPWRVLAELGRGGAGRVFRVHRDAHPPGLERALKLLHPGSVADARRRQRFEREARLLAGIDSGGVVRVHAVGEHEGCPYLVMDLVDGEPCDTSVDRLPGRGDRWQRAARFVAEVAEAVACAHDRGVLHRDLKPANVLVRRDGRPAVIDFGLARDPAASTLTGTGDILGTPAYMAPEQAVGRNVDERTDVYGLGAILYQLATGVAPHPGADSASVLRRVGSEPARPARAVCGRVPRALDRILRRAMAFRPERRFADARAMARALRAFADGVPLPSGATPGVSDRFEEAWRRHRKVAAGIAAAGLVLALAWSGWRWLDGGWTAARERERAALLLDAGTARLDGDWSAVQRSGLRLEALGDHALGPYFRGAADLVDPVARALAAGDALAGDPAAAAAAYAQARSDSTPPADGLVAGLLGLARTAAGDHDRALAELEVARRDYPGSWRIAHALAECHREAARHAEAAPLLEAAARISGSHAHWHEAAKCWVKADDQARGLAALDRALELAGDDVPPAYRRTEAACVGVPDRSIDILEQLIAKYPRMASLHYNLGFVLHRQHRVGEAYDRYLRAAEIDPDAVQARAMLAWIHGGMDMDCAECRASLSSRPELVDRAAARTRLEEVVGLVGGSKPAVLGALQQVAEANGLVAALDAAIGAYLDAPPAGATEKDLGRLLRFRQGLR